MPNKTRFPRIRSALRKAKMLLPGAKRRRFHALTFSALSNITFVSFHGSMEEKRVAFSLYRRFPVDSKNDRLELLETEANSLFQRCNLRLQQRNLAPTDS